MHGSGLHHGGLHNTGHGNLGVGHGVHKTPGPKPSDNGDLISAMNSSLAAMNVEQALALGLNPVDAANLQELQTQKRIAEEGEHYARELAGDVVGGGLTGFNMGGANNPRAATSSAFHSPLEAALHEAGPFGSRSALSANMLDSNDPTVRQRMQESIDTVHDDTLKANVAKKQRLVSEVLRKEEKAIKEMNMKIKMDASAAALRDQRAAEINAGMLAEKSGGEFEKIIPGTNKTYREEIDKQLDIAEHAGNHARNPDLYELENAAEKTGAPRPTLGKEIMEQTAREIRRKNIEEANRVQAEERRREEERRESSLAAAAQLQAEQAKADADRVEAQKRAKIESEAVAMAEANANYQQAQNLANNKIIQANEAQAAKIASASELRKQNELAAADITNASRSAEAEAMHNAEVNGFVAAATASAVNAAIQSDETLVAKLGEETAKELNAHAIQNQLAADAATHLNIKSQTMGEAEAASMNTAAFITNDAVAAAGEKSVAAQAAARGEELARAAAAEKQIANEARAMGADLASAKESESLIAANSREASAALIAAEKAKAMEKQFAQAAAAAATEEAATEEAGAAAAAAARQEEVAAAAVNEKAQIAAEHNALDAYDVLGTIPDDADTVAIANSSIKFPLKTFKAAQARNQAEAGALAAQAKIKDDIRGKVTANELDTPLNVIKGEGGYLNVPENAKSVAVDSGRAYFQEAAVAAMEKAGQDTSLLEHRINTGERANMGIGLGYYVANADGMTLDMPSPSNPDPPAVLTGNGHIIDVSHAEGLDIAKGELKLEKWEDYSRRVRPTVNANIVTNMRENITDSIIDDDCVKNALREADAMYNTKSEIITNPNGESYLKVTPPYGVSQQIPYDEAVFNLEEIKKSCRSNQGQIGVSMMEGKDQSTSSMKTKKKSLNIAEGLTLTAQSEEESLTKNALEDASIGSETHSIVTRHNAFDNQVHNEKNEIVNEGARILAEESGTLIEESTHEGAIKAKLLKEKEEIQESKGGMVSGGSSMETKEEEINVGMNVKERLLKGASKISKELNISEEEFTSLVEKVSISSIASMFNYVKHSSDKKSIVEFEKTKNEFRVLFGAGESSFTKVLMQTITNVTGYGDPNEQILIRKETTLVPKTVMTYTKPNSFGGTTTVKHTMHVPVVKTVRIPIRKIIRTIPGRGLTGKEIPVGDQIKNNQLMVGGPSDGKNSTGIEFVGSHGFNPNTKIKLGENGIIIGTNDDIKNLVDPGSISHINDIKITPGEIKRRVKKQGGSVPRKEPNVTNQIKEVVVTQKVGTECKGEECKTNGNNVAHSRKGILSNPKKLVGPRK